MTEGADPGAVQQQLDQMAGVERRTAMAGRRYVRRYLLGMGVAYAGWLLVVQAADVWLADNALARSVVIGLAVGLLFATALTPARAEPVRAQLTLRIRLLLMFAGAVCLGVPAALAHDYAIAAPVGAVVTLGFWAAMAWWTTRDR